MPKMTANQQSAFLLHIFTLMFNTPHALWPQAQIGDEWRPWIVGWPIKGKLFVNGTLRAIDINLNLASGTLQLRIMEQNPNKETYPGSGILKPTALRAKRGERIMWVINQGTGTWLGSIQNGQWVPSNKMATYPAQTQAQIPPAQMTAGAAMEEDASLTDMADDFIDIGAIPDVDINIDEFVQTYCLDDEDPEVM